MSSIFRKLGFWFWFLFFCEFRSSFWCLLGCFLSSFCASGVAFGAHVHTSGVAFGAFEASRAAFVAFGAHFRVSAAFLGVNLRVASLFSWCCVISRFSWDLLGVPLGIIWGFFENSRGILWDLFWDCLVILKGLCRVSLRIF